MRNLTSALLALTLTASSGVYAHAVVTHNSLQLKPVPVNQTSRQTRQSSAQFTSTSSR
jgi:copper resistance protein C